MTTRLMTKTMLGALIAFALLGTSKAHAQLTNFWGAYSASVHTDPNRPQDPGLGGRSYFTTQVEEAPGGVKFIIDLWHGKKDDPVSLYLQAAINDGSGRLESIPFMQLSDKVKDNPNNYHSRREFTISYKDLNEHLEKVLPAQAKQMKIGPGSPLLVLGKWPDYDHTWGGIARGGIVYLPDTHGSGQAQVAGKTRRATDLDIGYEIPQAMALLYNHTDATGKTVGLKQGGQIKSRLEAEGKYQIPLAAAPDMTKKLFDMSKDPAYAARILGPDWTITSEMKYMKKDPVTGQYLQDAHGLPIPDPMVDTYYDTLDNKGAQHDVAIRYRWTEGNGEGVWNFKPGLTHASADGVVKRIEYGVETTDDKPETIKKFADSKDPLNPFKLIRDLVPGTKPSDFLNPALKITDKRYKFKLKNTAGLVIEVSVDNVHAESLRMPGHSTRYVQMEMDVDHPSAQSANVAKPVNTGAGTNGYGAGSPWMLAIDEKIDPIKQAFLDGLTPHAFLDGRPVIHGADDLDPNSPLSQKVGPDLAIAESVIKSLRNEVIGANWMAAPQKASLAAVLLDHVDKAHASSSVKTLIEKVKSLRATGQSPGTMFEDGAPAGGQCRMVFTHIHH